MKVTATQCLRNNRKINIEILTAQGRKSAIILNLIAPLVRK